MTRTDYQKILNTFNTNNYFAVLIIENLFFERSIRLRGEVVHPGSGSVPCSVGQNYVARAVAL